MEGELLVIRLIVMVVFGAIAAAIASSKGRSVVGWFFGGFFLTLIGVIIVSVLPNLKEQRSKEEAIERENRRLREQLVQEQIKTEAFRRHASARLDAHDSHIGVDTRSISTALPEPTPMLGLPGHGSNSALNLGQAGTFNSGQSSLTPANRQQPSAMTWQQSALANSGQYVASADAQNAQAQGAGVTAIRQWFFDNQGSTHGPLTDRQLIDLAKQGTIVSSTLIWTEELHDWKPAGSVKPLQPFLIS
jgi:hypothetical protein